MGFDYKRFIRDLQRNPVKAQTDAANGRYNQTKNPLQLRQLHHWLRNAENFEKWNAQAQLSRDARTALDEIIRRTSVDVFSPVENEIRASIERFRRAHNL